ncbi:hypothetical protein QG37_04021 [Candidozyma auris]|uniref:Uncharacterized protein n=1 Tax=Candidozyma auris TaxID=498019 RepID=A0A0L0NXN8_CANAR|nr:hypothetical protein QG37_04021 [[Candida] auris]
MHEKNLYLVNEMNLMIMEGKEKKNSNHFAGWVI